MSISEFRYNKKRKHYSYIHGQRNDRRKNILITSKPVIRTKKKDIHNKPLFHHPNKYNDGQYYVVIRNYSDDKSCFGDKTYDWNWDRNDKRTIKRIKRKKYK